MRAGGSKEPQAGHGTWGTGTTRAGPMREYRCFFLLKDGRIARPSAFFTCVTDQDAVTKAEQMADGLDFEIWDGNRNIVRGKPPNRS